MTLPAVAPLILTGVPLLMPQASVYSNTTVYFQNLDQIWKPLNQAKLRTNRTVPDTRNSPTPPSQMLLPLNPKSLNGRNVFLQMAHGMFDKAESGFFASEEDDDGLWP